MSPAAEWVRTVSRQTRAYCRRGGADHDRLGRASAAGRAVAVGARPVGVGLRCHPGRVAAGFWLDPATVHALSISLIAAVYVGFAVADGRPQVIAVESAVAGGFVVIAATAVTGTAWLLVVGYAGHGLKDFWQERHHYVANTRWWPPFCATVDWLVAMILVLRSRQESTSTTNSPRPRTSPDGGGWGRRCCTARSAKHLPVSDSGSPA